MSSEISAIHSTRSVSSLHRLPYDIKMTVVTLISTSIEVARTSPVYLFLKTSVELHDLESSSSPVGVGHVADPEQISDGKD